MEWFRNQLTSLIYKSGFIRVKCWSTTLDQGGWPQEIPRPQDTLCGWDRPYWVFRGVFPLVPPLVWKRSNHWCGVGLRGWIGKVKCPPITDPPVQDFLNGSLNTPCNPCWGLDIGDIRDRQHSVHHWCVGCSNGVWTVRWVYPSKDFFVPYVNDPLNR